MAKCKYKVSFYNLQNSAGNAKYFISEVILKEMKVYLPK